MDTIIDMTRDLAHALQGDERFIRTQLAQAAADEDKELQALIGEFNLKRIALNNENVKEEKDGDKITALDGEIREIYARIMANPHMSAYQQAKEGLDALVRHMASIITLSAQGQDPDGIEPSGCSGSCSTCGGCQ
ncbi:MAG: YlbF family regulator [Clostridiales bacterium]|nr:YlbF family regulator [Clostridiales bacterium]